jgi:hypothetical protein
MHFDEIMISVDGYQAEKPFGWSHFVQFQQSRQAQKAGDSPNGE